MAKIQDCWRIRYEVLRHDGTLYIRYTPIHYYSYIECKRVVDSLNEVNNVRKVSVHHYVELNQD